MRESDLHRLIQIAASAEGHRLFRMNVAMAWVGEVFVKTPETITLRNYRTIRVGVEGMADLGGWTNRGGAAWLEVKTGLRRPTPPQVDFVTAAATAGGVGAVVWSVEEALAALRAPGRPDLIRDRTTIR